MFSCKHHPLWFHVELKTSPVHVPSSIGSSRGLRQMYAGLWEGFVGGIIIFAMGMESTERSRKLWLLAVADVLGDVSHSRGSLELRN